MKRMLRDLLILLVGLTVGVVVSLGRPTLPPRPGGMQTRGDPPTLEAVRSLATLTTTSVGVSDVQLTELRGYTGGAKAALIVRGDFAVGTELSQASFQNVDPVTKNVVLMLPLPSTGPPRVDLSRTQLVTVKSDGLWQVVPGNEAELAVTDEALRQAQQSVQRVSHRPEWSDRAKQQTERVLQAFFRSIGWSVELRWRP